jgi:hypothetical protein
MSTVDDSQPILTPDEGTRKFFYDKTESLIAEAVEACSELADPFDMSVRGRLTQAESILKFTKDLSVPASSQDDKIKYNDLRSWVANALSLIEVHASNGTSEETSPEVFERARKVTSSLIGHVNVYSLLSNNWEAVPDSCENCSKFATVRQLVPSIYTCLEYIPSTLSDRLKSVLLPVDALRSPAILPSSGHQHDAQNTIYPLSNTLSEIMQSLEDTLGSEDTTGCPQQAYNAARVSVESCKNSLAAIEEAIQSQPTGEGHERVLTMIIDGFGAFAV